MQQQRKRNLFDVLETLNNNDKNREVAPNVLIRVDFNVPMNDSNGTISDDSRIRGALPTIQATLHSKCNVILMSHMGRPKLVQKGQDDGTQRSKLSLRPVAQRLSELLLNDKEVGFAPDCLEATKHVQALPAEGGSVLLLENLRFYPHEEENSVEFAKRLASYADAYINDAFGTCHRAHASTAGIPAIMKDPQLCGIGSLVASELSFLDFSSTSGEAGVAAIIGGSKVSSKLPVIRGLLKQVDTLILGGGLAFTFLKAQGVAVGNSLVEDEMLDTALELVEEAQRLGKTLVIPVDAVCTQSFPKGNSMRLEDTKSFDLTPDAGIEHGWMGLDVGPKTVALFHDALKGCSKIVFNGPMGVFEVSPFDEGTKGLVDVICDLTQNHGCTSVVGGGDSVAALEAFGKTKDVSYVSTGGGATLELLAGDVLPGVEAIGNVDY